VLSLQGTVLFLGVPAATEAVRPPWTQCLFGIDATSRGHRRERLAGLRQDREGAGLRRHPASRSQSLLRAEEEGVTTDLQIEKADERR
jgi:hypothetical protein